MPTPALVLELDLSTLRLPDDFTDAERDVLLCMFEGLSNAEIAARRQRSERTVANQIAAMLRKAGAFNRTDLLARCTRASAAAGQGRGWSEFVEGRWRVKELARTDHFVRCVAEPNPRSLTATEQRVLQEASVGTPNKLLGDAMRLGEAATTKCLERALRKLGVARRTNLPVLRAIFS
jgi:DNA-binding NarL/FixJ family response regulator